MENRFKLETFYPTLNFKTFLEMAHIVAKQFGPLQIHNNQVKMLDLKFEYYPNIELKRKLLLMGAKFFGKIPDEIHSFFVYDGKQAWVSNQPPKDFIELPNDWWDYAQVFFSDGTIKEPTKP